MKKKKIPKKGLRQILEEQLQINPKKIKWKINIAIAKLRKEGKPITIKNISKETKLTTYIIEYTYIKSNTPFCYYFEF